MNPDLNEFSFKRLTPNDLRLFQQLIRLFQEVFETPDPQAASEPHLQRLLEKPGFIAYVVLLKHEVIGGLTAYELPLYYAEKSELFLYDLAVHPDFQRQGLGRHLLATLRQYSNQHGIQTLFVAASEEDTEAVEFYHSTGGWAENVVLFTYSPDE